MARLILVNGLPASGKSTLARRYVDDHPLAMALDVDVVRSLLGRWLDHSAEAGLAARRLALAMARSHLQSGHDVVVPQFLGRLEFVLRLEQLATEVDALFIEVALLNTAADIEARFLCRSSQPERSEHLDATALLERRGGLGELVHMQTRLLEVVAMRPRTRTLITIDGNVDDAYRDLLTAVDNG